MNIISSNNEKIKYFAKLQMKKNREEEQKFIIEGDHLVEIALKKGVVLDLICTADLYEFENKYVVSDQAMKKISKQISPPKVAAVCKYNYGKIEAGNSILIDALQDPGNLGTIIRSAVAFNFRNIILGTGTVDIYNDKTIRASEGMLFNINIVKMDLFEAIKILKEKNYLIIGTDVNGGKKIKEVKDDVAIIIGNEGAGMNKLLKKECHYLVNIPMSSDCESLNAGVAASILMYEVNNG